VTPEATREVVGRELPGFGELMRAVSLRSTVFAAGSRALAGIAGETLVINLPGSPQGARECFEAVSRPARHVLDLIGGGAGDCGPARSAGEPRPG
jgi:molybdopterin biosynthesis enzyme MoaB